MRRVLAPSTVPRFIESTVDLDRSAPPPTLAILNDRIRRCLEERFALPSAARWLISGALSHHAAEGEWHLPTASHRINPATAGRLERALAKPEGLTEHGVSTLREDISTLVHEHVHAIADGRGLPGGSFMVEGLTELATQWILDDVLRDTGVAAALPGTLTAPTLTAAYRGRVDLAATLVAGLGDVAGITPAVALTDLMRSGFSGEGVAGLLNRAAEGRGALTAPEPAVIQIALVAAAQALPEHVDMHQLPRQVGRDMGLEVLAAVYGALADAGAADLPAPNPANALDRFPGERRLATELVKADKGGAEARIL